MLVVHSLTLDHVAGVDHAHLELPETGVVVVHGPNEMGKTTLLTAFRLLLSDTPVTSKAKKVRELKSASQDVASTVAADLTVGEHRLTVTKSFNKGSGGCELVVTAPRRENLTGRQAAERFSSLLAAEVDTGLLEALTIDQGESLDILAAAGIRSLEQALGDSDDSRGGRDSHDSHDTVSSARAGSADETGTAALIDRISGEYARYYTKTGQPSRELKEARSALATAVAEHDEAQTRYDRAQGLVADLERLRGEKDDIARREPDAVRDADEAEAALDVGRRAAAELERHRSDLATARESLDFAEQRRTARAGQIRTLAEADSEIGSLEEAVAQAARAADQEQEKAGALRTRLATTRRESWVAKAWSGYLAARDRHREAEVTLAELSRRFGKATEISDTVDDRDRALRADPATLEALEDLRRCGERLAQAVTVRDATATTVTVTGPAEGTALVDGTPLDLDGSDGGGATIHATARRELQLGEYTVTVVPARDVHEADDDVDRARVEHDRALAVVGAADQAAAEDMGRRRAALGEELHGLRLELAQVTGDRTVAELGEARDRAADELDAAAKAVTTALEQLRAEDPDGEISLDGVPAGAVGDPETVTASAAGLRSLSDAAARRGETLQEDLDTATRAGAVVRLEGRRRELERSVEARDRLATALQEAREENPDGDLDSAVEQRRAAVGEAEQAYTAAEEKAGDVDVDELTALATAATTRVRRLRERAVATGNALSEASGALSQHGGVAEDLAETGTVRERAERTCRRVERQAEAARLLHTTVQAAVTAARERYEAPFRETFERLARTLYGGQVDFEFDADLSVARRSFQGVSLDTTQLSGGAREQLSVLTRLAVADLVGGGDAVPVFIDDALGFSDRGRIGRMNLVLDSLGRDHQIIVLTCDVARFEGVAGADFVPMERVRSDAD